VHTYQTVGGAHAPCSPANAMQSNRSEARSLAIVLRPSRNSPSSYSISAPCVSVAPLLRSPPLQHVHEFLEAVYPYYNIIIWSATGSAVSTRLRVCRSSSPGLAKRHALPALPSCNASPLAPPLVSAAARGVQTDRIWHCAKPSLQDMPAC